VRHGNHKLVTKSGDAGPIQSVFDLSSDPEERHDLAGSKPEVTRALLDLMKEWEAVVRPQR